MPTWSIDLDLDGFELDPEDLLPSIPLKKVPAGDVFEAARAGDVDRLRCLLDSGVNVNSRDRWDSVALYYACLAGHVEAARMLLEAGAICSEHTFEGDRCHYAALNLRVRRLLKAFEARPPPLAPLPAALRDTFLSCPANRVAYLEQCDDFTASALRAADLSHYYEEKEWCEDAATNSQIQKAAAVDQLAAKETDELTTRAGFLQDRRNDAGALDGTAQGNRCGLIRGPTMAEPTPIPIAGTGPVIC